MFGKAFELAMFLGLGLFIDIARCDDDLLCKSVTLGDCPFNEDLIIDRRYTPTAIICQSTCELYADCNTFSFDGSKTQDNCVLLKYDYRQSCKDSAGLENTDLANCLASSEETCDRIMEEGCEYLGEIIYEVPAGEAQSPEYCQELCPLFHCTYWSYKGSSKVCKLYDSENRECQGLGGGQTPKIQACMEQYNISTTTPHTTSSTTPYTGPTTTPDRRCPFTIFKGDEKNLVPLGPEDECCKDMSCVNDNNFCNDWAFQDDGTFVYQSKNNEPASILLNALEVQGVDFNGTMNVDKNADADWIGISFGYKDVKNFYVLLSPGINNRRHKDHWRVTKVQSTTGDTNKDMANAITYSEMDVEGQTKILWRDTADEKGWKFDTKYLWQLQYRPVQGYFAVQIYEKTEDDITLVIDTGDVMIEPSDEFEQFGIFARSQPSVSWFDMTYECFDE